VGNYKLLQKAFTKNKVQRYVDVDKLIRGKYQDNLEFCQWLKAFFDMKNDAAGEREDYDPVAVRAKGRGGKAVPVMTKKGGSGGAGSRARAPVRSSSSMSSSSVRSGGNAPVVGRARIGSSASSTSSARAAPSATATSSRSSPRRMTSSSSASTATTSTTGTARSSRPTRERPVPTQKENNSATNLATNLPKTSCKPATTATTTTTSTPSISTAQIKKYQEEIKHLKTQNTTLTTQLTNLQLLSTELELNMTTVESERDFYFEKLRGIEVMLQVYKEKEESGELVSLSSSPRGSSGGAEMKRVIEKIFRVMYAAVEDNVVVDDEGNLVGDVTMDESVVQNNESFGSIRPHAQDELANDDDDDELLTSGIVDPVEVAPVAVEQVQVNMAQMSDDDDDDELLTSGIISPVNEVVIASSDAVENIGIAAAPELEEEDDDELLTSGIDSGDDAVPEGDASNRDAENDRIISQLVGDNDDDGISDEELLVDDASQNEY